MCSKHERMGLHAFGPYVTHGERELVEIHHDPPLNSLTAGD